MAVNEQGVTALEHSLEDLYENAPCGYLSLLPDGTIVMANRTFIRSVGYPPAELIGRRLQDLLTPGSRLYHDTHWGPKLALQGEVREVPADVRRVDGTTVSVLLTATSARGADGAVSGVRVSLFDATDRRRYERELIGARDTERAGRERAERLQRISGVLAGANSYREVAGAVLPELVAMLRAVRGALVVGGTEVAGHPLMDPDRAVAREPEVLRVELRAGEADLGQLCFEFSRERALAEAERTFVDTCAALCAQSLVRTQLFVEATERSRRQTATARLGARALGDVDLPALLREAAGGVRRILGVDAVDIVQRDGTVAVVMGQEPAGQAPTFDTPIGAGDAGYGTLRIHTADSRRMAPGEIDFVNDVVRVLWTFVERGRQDALTRHQATHDPLTDLPNRLLLSERIAHEVARSKRNGTKFAVYLLDIDDFKLVNDTLGHQTGDELLCLVSERLSEAGRATDMLARLGGDEFVMLAPDLCEPEEAEAQALRIGESLEASFRIHGSDLVVRASVGVVLGEAASTAEGLLRDADVAMYEAKARGRGLHAFFDDTMRDRVETRMRVEADLINALREGHLRVFYQPVATAQDRELTGAEALVRLQHPSRGLVGPNEFIDVAESTGLIVELGRQVLEQACGQLVSWRADGLVDDAFSVAVNVSWRQLVQPGFAGQVAAVLEATGLPARLLGLEVTETMIMDSDEVPEAVLHDLAALGIELLLDDFGTGVSSLARLKRLPVHTLKIDRAFVQGLGESDGEDGAIVSAIVSMSRALGLNVIAEGIETPGQLEAVAALGCEHVQGFLFSRPLPVDQLDQLLSDAATGVQSAGLTAPASPAAPGA